MGDSSKGNSQLFKTVASIASSLKNSILYVLIGGASAVFFLAWQWIDFSTGYMWIILKAIPLLLPLALWGLLYLVIVELADSPIVQKQPNRMVVLLLKD